jgi:hypothetical protein
MEWSNLAAPRAHVDPNRPFGVVEPRIADRYEEPLRRSFVATDDEKQGAFLERIENQAVDSANAMVAQIQHSNAADGPAPPQFQILTLHECRTPWLFAHLFESRVGQRRTQSKAGSF